jgi:hypothetical protein
MMAVEDVIETYDVEYAVSVELDDGRIIEGTGKDIAEACRRLADAVEEATR